MKLPLSDGTYTLVTAADFERFKRWRWHRVGDYAVRYTSRYDRERHGAVTDHRLLHREIMGLTRGDGLEVDHRNGDGLDNRRRNLLVVTRGQQMQNHAAHRGGTSRHRGVSWHTARGQWRCAVYTGGRQHFGGYFTDEEEAAKAASALRAKLMTHTNEERHPCR